MGESAYPYTSGRTGDVGACRPSSNGYNTDFKLTGMWNQWFTNENDMEGLVAMNPVVTAVQVTNGWGGYNGGILDPATAARPPLTATACTTSTTPSWSSDTDPTTGSSRTPGEPAGERTDTSGSSVDPDTAELYPSTRPSPTADRDHA